MKLKNLVLVVFLTFLTAGCSTVRYVNDPAAQYQHQVQLKASKVEKLAGREPGALPVTSIRGAAWYTEDGEYYIIGLDFDALEGGVIVGSSTGTTYFQDHASSGWVTLESNSSDKIDYTWDANTSCTVLGHPSPCNPQTHPENWPTDADKADRSPGCEVALPSSDLHPKDQD